MYWNTIRGQLTYDKLPARRAIANDREQGDEMTTFEIRASSRPLAGEELRGRVALVTRSTRATDRVWALNVTGEV